LRCGAQDLGSEFGHGPTDLQGRDQGAGAGGAPGSEGKGEAIEQGLYGGASGEGDEAFPGAGHFRPGIEGKGQSTGLGEIRNAIAHGGPEVAVEGLIQFGKFGGGREGIEPSLRLR